MEWMTSVSTGMTGDIAVYVHSDPVLVSGEARE